ncbi:hypothetical protein LCGC14_3164920, partial [marine sediment metagenome]
NSVGISSASYSDVVAIIHGDLDLPTPRAYAEELIRRWNAFEEGGLVEKLINKYKHIIYTAEAIEAITVDDEMLKIAIIETCKEALAEAKKCIEE